MRYRSQKGLTLVELMITIMLLAIIASAAIPAMQSLFGRKNVHAVGKIFEQSIQLARAEAIQRSTTVRVLPAIDGDNWSEGWEIEYTDPVDGSIQTIRNFSAVSGNATFRSDDFTTDAPLTILPNGQVTLLGTFELFYNDCANSPDRLDYQILLSGLLKKTVNPCQP